MFTAIIPSYNEEGYIGECLKALLAQTGLPRQHAIQVIVAANACTDKTVNIAEGFADRFSEAGYQFLCLDISQPGKMNALNTAEQHALYANRVYIDADVIISSLLFAELAEQLNREDPVYVSGQVIIPRSKSWITRAYARVWTSLPFVRQGVSGIGLYAFNKAGRARWSEFPNICNDDKFVRLQFKPSERIKLKSAYYWPLPDGFIPLIKVRRRWCEGNDEIGEKYPQLLQNDSERNNSFGNALTLLKTPLSSAIFVSVYLISSILAKQRSKETPVPWRRGRS